MHRRREPRDIVSLQSADGSRIYASKRISGIGTQWSRHAFTLRPNTTDDKARLAVTIDRPGKVAVDQVTLMDTGDALFHSLPYPKLVNTAWWRPESSNVERVFRALDGKADYWDYHPWADALTSGREVEAELRRMKELFTQWNPRTTMKCAIFEENGNLHDIQRMLGHVTLQNAVRRMGGFVLTSCAANTLQPFRQNDNGWDQGQVFFTPTQVWGMPPYYAQQMAAAVHQPLLIESQSSSTDLDVTATRDPKGRKLVLHIANTGARYADVSLHLNGMTAKRLRATTLSGDPESRNTPEAPERFVPMSRELEKGRPVTLPPYSYTIIEVVGSVVPTDLFPQDQAN